eukprot:CAMPEP_0119116328 /NCGR_PEP_ID=MMETSP1180-20130426/52224_1 /TAXON_ID=3052 ORGANISM="Chlamydomonas cf sp, Strain CCMP681" /NCGR_SAMPLE_ID=MMETSP1180 /ASSEMBLY_ACC=CAM_ASM_000741 /LENGTH=66 /DNA_ID=CAMNT_0007105461 /DNA_START=1405 /DNA_END=1601 /DNA_ORIENTATION=+
MVLTHLGELFMAQPASKLPRATPSCMGAAWEMQESPSMLTTTQSASTTPCQVCPRPAKTGMPLESL